MGSGTSAIFLSLLRPILTSPRGPEHISSRSLVAEGCTHSNAGAGTARGGACGDSEVAGLGELEGMDPGQGDGGYSAPNPGGSASLALA